VYWIDVGTCPPLEETSTIKRLADRDSQKFTNMTLYDIYGRQIIKNITTLSNQIKLSDNIDSGLYMLTLKYNNGDIINKKVVITR